jgi:hypothetical protein
MVGAVDRCCARGDAALAELCECHLEVLSRVLQRLRRSVVSLHCRVLLKQLHQLAQQHAIAEGVVERVQGRIFRIIESQPV